MACSAFAMVALEVVVEELTGQHPYQVTFHNRAARLVGYLAACYTCYYWLPARLGAEDILLVVVLLEVVQVGIE